MEVQQGPWRAAGASVTGARHIHQGKPCQDALEVRVTDQALVLALADGHGDEKHARSDVGASIAVDVAAEILQSLANDLIEEPSHPVQVQRTLARHLPRRIQWEWIRRVREHAGHEEPSGEWHEDTKLYGTTLIAGLIVGELALFLRLGDGDVVIWSPDDLGASVFGAHEALYGSQTYSLCQPDGATRTEISCLFTDELSAALLVTDGVTDSLESDLPTVVDWLVNRVHDEGWSQVASSLPAWLEELTARGNGDDVTLGLIQRQGDD